MTFENEPHSPDDLFEEHDYDAMTEEERREFRERVRRELPESRRAVAEHVRRLRRYAAGLPPGW